MKINPNLKFLREQVPNKRIVALQGGTRSGKTYSAVQYLIELACQYSGLTISICRETLPVLKATVLRDFIDIMLSEGFYDERYHNKTEGVYEFNGNLFEFFSLDQPRKVRGRKRHILYLNEAMPDVDLESWKQLLFRTAKTAIIDYNPSEPEHWIYDEVLSRPDCALLVTTYKDNPHLNKSIVAEIERYRETDPDYFKVFGVGLRGVGRVGQIFTHVQKCDSLPAGTAFYGLDFGKTNDPTALVKMVYTGGALYCQELIYQTNLSSSEIVSLMKQAGVGRMDMIRADGAEPLMIREIKQAGFNIVPAIKGQGSVWGVLIS